MALEHRLELAGKDNVQLARTGDIEGDGKDELFFIWNEDDKAVVTIYNQFLSGIHTMS